MPNDRKREIDERLPPIPSPAPGRAPSGTGDRDLSGNVPWGPASEPGAAAGLSAGTPAPAVLPPPTGEMGTGSDRATDEPSTSPTGPTLPER